MEKRLEDLEMKVAFQDKAILELNEVIVSQQRQIDQLKKELEVVRARLINLTPSLIASQAEETRPPHY